MQDASSQRVAEFCRPQSGMRVVDTCAGAGGKTLHLSALMQNKGQIIAMDIFAHKLEELKKRAKRDGVFNVQTRLAEAKTIKRLAQTADIVLIDATCSGLGVLKRNPDAKWKLTPEKIDQIRQEQAQILSQYSKIAKVGGKVVYATCSILPSENQQQVKHFLISPEAQAFRFVREEIILAHLTGFDGFYMAELVREK